MAPYLRRVESPKHRIKPQFLQRIISPRRRTCFILSLAAFGEVGARQVPQQLGLPRRQGHARQPLPFRDFSPTEGHRARGARFGKPELPQPFDDMRSRIRRYLRLDPTPLHLFNTANARGLRCRPLWRRGRRWRGVEPCQLPDVELQFPAEPGLKFPQSATNLDTCRAMKPSRWSP